MPTWQDHLDEHRKQAEDRLKELLRIPSVSTDPAHEEDCQDAAAWVRTLLEDVGFDASLETVGGGHPIVVGRYEADEEAPTITLYGHYDVQPPDPQEAWTTPPFEPTVEEGAKGRILRARGATDDKGQVVANLLALEAHAETGTLDVNVNVLIEGEEEVGGESLPTYIRGHEEDLVSDAVVVSDTHLWDGEHPAIVHGLRGVVALEAIVKGPKRDLHSGIFGGIVTNPAEALAKAVATLKDEDRRVRVPGFYDDVRELDEEQRRLIDQVPFEDARMLEETGVDELVGEAGYSTLERLWGRPSLEVNGLGGGYHGQGFKTVIGEQATAKISVRTVPDQDGETIGQAVLDHLDANLVPGVTLRGQVLQTAPPWYVSPNHPVLAAAADSLERAFGGETVFIRNGASIPVVPTLGRLGPVALMGYGMQDERLHAPDEFFRLDHFHKGAKAFGTFLDQAAGGFPS